MSKRTHAPWCDTVLGPDFEVGPGVVVMTLFACVGFECWDDPPTADAPPSSPTS